MSERWASTYNSNSVNIKREIHCRDDNRSYMLLVGVSRGRLRLRQQRRGSWGWGKVEYLDAASTDLKSLAALWICYLLPSGVLADRLEEEQPQYADAANALRVYDDIVAEQETKLKETE